MSGILGLLLHAVLLEPSGPAEDGEIFIRFREEPPSRAPGGLASRCSIRRSDGTPVVPGDALPHRGPGGEPFFYVADSTPFPMRPGDYVLEAVRGIEGVPSRVGFSVSSGRRTEISVPLKRWVSMAEEGWYSGDPHVRVGSPPDDHLKGLRDRALGEDLNVLAVAVGRGDSFSGTTIDSTHAIIRAEEIDAPVAGPVRILHAGTLPEGLPDPDDLAAVRGFLAKAVRQGGVPGCPAPAGAPGPGGQGGSLLAAEAIAGPLAFVGLDAGGDRDGSSIEAYLDAVWYPLLSTGRRLAASAGSVFSGATGPSGAARVYVKLSEPFGPGAWVKALGSGRSFVTNGPVLEMSLDVPGTDLPPGAEVWLPHSGIVEIRARARYHTGLGRLEIIRNGAVVARSQGSAGGGSPEITFDGAIPVPWSSWIAARCFGPDPRSPRFAHTSPLYVPVGDAPVREAAAAARILEEMDGLMAAADRIEDARSALRRARRDVLEIARIAGSPLAIRPSQTRMNINADLARRRGRTGRVLDLRISNPSTEPYATTIRFAADRGWNLSPVETELLLPPRGERLLPVTLYPPPGDDAFPTRIAVRATASRPPFTFTHRLRWTPFDELTVHEVDRLDGLPDMVKRQDRYAYRMRGRLYFDVDDAFLVDGDARVEVDLLLFGEGYRDHRIRIEYDSHLGEYHPTEEKELPRVLGWHTLTFSLVRARFANRQRGCDFRIVAPPAHPTYVGQVTVRPRP